MTSAESGYSKHWFWWTKEGFTHEGEKEKKEPKPLDLEGTDQFDIKFNALPNYPKKIDTFTVRLHNVSCKNSRVTAVGKLESYVWKKDEFVRIVPTWSNTGGDLPPYWVALPPFDTGGTLVIIIIDHEPITELLLPSGKLRFMWEGSPVSPRSKEKAKLWAKSLELHVVCK